MSPEFNAGTRLNLIVTSARAQLLASTYRQRGKSELLISPESWHLPLSDTKNKNHELLKNPSRTPCKLQMSEGNRVEKVSEDCSSAPRAISVISFAGRTREKRLWREVSRWLRQL